MYSMGMYNVLEEYKTGGENLNEDKFKEEVKELREIASLLPNIPKEIKISVEKKPRLIIEICEKEESKEKTT